MGYISIHRNWVTAFGSSRYVTGPFVCAAAQRGTTLSRILGQYAYAILSAPRLGAFRVWFIRGSVLRVYSFVGGTLENLILR